MGKTSLTVLAIISHYHGRPVEPLVALLGQIAVVPAGFSFRVRIVVNQDEPVPLALPLRQGITEICFRENTGLNIGAWEYGWRLSPAYDAYLFLQDDCRIVREDWLAAFLRKAAEPGIGLVGECLSPVWDTSWEELGGRFQGERMQDHLIDGRPADRVPCYLDFFRRHGIPPGLKGDHLQSLVLFAKRTVLEAVDGFPVGQNYGEAIAAEIGISKKVQALGLKIAEVGPQPFSYIEHPQWLHRRPVR